MPLVAITNAGFVHPLYENLYGNMSLDSNGEKIIQWRNNQGIVEFSTSLMDLVDAHIEAEREVDNDWKRDPLMWGLIHEMARVIEEIETRDTQKPLGRRL